MTVAIGKTQALEGDVSALRAQAEEFRANGTLLREGNGTAVRLLGDLSTSWSGDAADAAAESMGRAEQQVRRISDAHVDAADAADSGADAIEGYQLLARTSITQAEAEDFRVAEDGSVTAPSALLYVRGEADPEQLVAAQHALDEKARQYETSIKQNLAGMATEDAEAAEAISSAFEGMSEGDMNPEGPPTDHSTEDRSDDPLYPNGEPSIDDIDQGDFGDCWLLAALGSTALSNPDKIKDLITDNGDGTYTVHFQDGDVTVNDDALLDQGADQGKWVAVVETAYAERDGGTYDEIEGGFSDHAYQDLFGADTGNFDPDSTNDLFFGDNKSPGDSYNEMQSALNDGRPVTASVDGRIGIDGGHALIVTNVYERDGVQYVEMMNPHASNSTDIINGVEEAGGEAYPDGRIVMNIDDFSEEFYKVRYVKDWD
ncbi:MAG: C2 family cysteine protease [Actinophytocola sp.]|uniref:C2 family cysteine protease n=1 Tax=Actinophytocola sp. TaxID=1872138 RepID=UPI003C73E745